MDIDALLTSLLLTVTLTYGIHRLTVVLFAHKWAQAQATFRRLEEESAVKSAFRENGGGAPVYFGPGGKLTDD